MFEWESGDENGLMSTHYMLHYRQSLDWSKTIRKATTVYSTHNSYNQQHKNLNNPARNITTTRPNKAKACFRSSCSCPSARKCTRLILQLLGATSGTGWHLRSPQNTLPNCVWTHHHLLAI